MNLTSIHVLSLALLSGLRILHSSELWCRSQTPLRSHVAAAPIGPLAWEPPYTAGNGPRKGKKKKTKKKNKCLELDCLPSLPRLVTYQLHHLERVSSTLSLSGLACKTGAVTSSHRQRLV